MREEIWRGDLGCKKKFVVERGERREICKPKEREEKQKKNAWIKEERGVREEI